MTAKLTQVMNKSAGTLLREARLRKDLTLDDASRSTKIRREQLICLENDDFSRFANMAYAKGFLLIYARYLGVDVSAHASSITTGNPVGTSDYDYLNAPAEFYEPAKPAPRKIKLNYRMVLSTVAVAGCMLWLWQFSIKLALIGSPERFENKHKVEDIAAPQTTAPLPAAAPSPTGTPAPTPASIPSTPSIASILEFSPSPSIEIRRAEPLTESFFDLQPSNTPGNDVKEQQPRKSRTH